RRRSRAAARRPGDPGASSRAGHAARRDREGRAAHGLRPGRGTQRGPRLSRDAPLPPLTSATATSGTMSQTSAPDLTMNLGEDYPEIRESVRRICADYPGSYWRTLDEEEAYPSDFVKAMTEAGFLAALIPEQYG